MIKMIKLENWKEITRGLYRYVYLLTVVMRSISYIMKTILIFYQLMLRYILSESRELLLKGPLIACLEKAVEDEKEMRE